MRLHSCVLITKDLPALRRFYGKVMGLKVTADYGACIFFGQGLSLWAPGAGHAVRAGKARGRAQGQAFELCFEADTPREFDALAARLFKAKAPLLHGIQHEAWGQRTLRAFDPDHNLVEWGESIPCFVRRLAAEGLSARAVALKTGVGLGQVRKMLSKA